MPACFFGWLAVKENEGIDALNDIDDFENRLARGPAPRKPAQKPSAVPQRRPQQAAGMKGKDYVQNSKHQRRPMQQAAGDDREDDADDAKKAVDSLPDYGSDDD